MSNKEERQPPEWEAQLRSMELRRRREKLVQRELVFDAMHEQGFRKVDDDRRQPLIYGRQKHADPAHQLDLPAPQPWEREDIHLFVRRLLSHLPEREAQVVRMRWGIGQPERSQAYICHKLGISRMTSYNAERRAFRRMRTALGIPDDPPDTATGKADVQTDQAA